MSLGLSPIGNDAPFVDANGDPLSGGKLYVYLAGSATPVTTYQDAGGTTPNANPVILNSNGYPASGGSVVEIWLTDGATYLFELKTSADVLVWSRDDIEVINDTSVTNDQWVTGPTPTYISATSFSLVGDQTTTFHVGRRLQTTNTGGTVYSTILTSAFTSLTTITVLNDSGSLDSGLSAVNYGVLSNTNPSIPNVGFGVIAQNSQSGDYTLLATDSGKHILHPTADNNPRTFTIPADTSVAFPVGTMITFVNQINTLSIAITTDTMTMMGSGATGTRTLAANGIATALKVASTSWVISGTNLS